MKTKVFVTLMNDITSLRSTEKLARRKIVIVSGMSGAGLSTALKAFEDLGYEAVDNLRLSLIPTLVDDSTTSGQPLAIAIDTRNANFAVDDLISVLNTLGEKQALDSKLVFLECSDDALQRRFTETRRRHPLAADRPVTDGIKREREMLWRLRDQADHVIDTSILSIHDLRRLIVGHYRIDASNGLTLFMTSFSYRHGVPREADLVFDARFLVNPHWEAKLRPLSGQDLEIADFVMRDPDYDTFMKHMIDLMAPLLPRYQQEGKSYLTIAIGCTGGRHRSVVVAEQLATHLAARGYIVGVGHRDMDRTTK
jgi:UPF0042 nucleotide-binding protein